MLAKVKQSTPLSVIYVSVLPTSGKSFLPNQPKNSAADEKFGHTPSFLYKAGV
jgi:hypothetical protein